MVLVTTFTISVVRHRPRATNLVTAADADLFLALAAVITASISILSLATLVALAALVAVVAMVVVVDPTSITAFLEI